MSDYTKLVDFAGKDILATGSALKVIQGTEINDELIAIATAVGSKANLISAQLTGLPVADTAAVSTSTTQLATTEYVMVQAAATEALALPVAGGTMTAGAVIANFESTGIDDNATSTKVTVSDTGVDVTGTVTADGLTVDGRVVVYDTTQTMNGGIATEANAAIINFGLNEGSANRFGGSYTQANQGGMLNFDTRAGQPLFQIYTRAAGIAEATGTASFELNSAGNVGIGATPESWLSTQTALQVGGTGSITSTTTAAAGADTHYGQNVYLNTSGAWVYQVTDQASLMSQNDGQFRFRTAVSGAADGAITWKAAMTIDNSGNVTALGNVTAYSDERLKSNIETIPDALEKILSIRGVNFDMNGVRGTGVIAQDLEQVLPEAVFDNEETELKSVAYGNVVGLLIEAIKEQQIQIDNLMYLIGED